MHRTGDLAIAIAWILAIGPLSGRADPLEPGWSDGFAHGGVNGQVFALTVFDEDGDGPGPEALFAGGFFTQAGGQPANRVARWNGGSWSPLGAGLDSTVHAMIVFDDDGSGPQSGNLIVGGGFTSAGGVTANRIARWTGAAWVPVATGFNAAVQTLATFDEDGDGPNPPRLFAGGIFTVAGGAPAKRIARWDGEAWSAVGAGFNGAVRALAVFDADGAGPHPAVLVAGGSFTLAGATPVARIASWNGSAWAALGSGLNNTVLTLEIHDADGAAAELPRLYAGGDFTSAGGVPANRVARWNGVVWSPLASGTNGSVERLTSIDPDADGPAAALLYAGGPFSLAGGLLVSHVARWDGIGWAGMATGVWGVPGARVGAFAKFDADGPGPGMPTLVAAGEFTIAGGIAAERVATWSGSAWAPLGGGLSGPSFGALVFDADGDGPETPAVYVVGNFTTSGTVLSNGVAKLSQAGWQSLGSGVGPAQVYCVMAFDPDSDGAAPRSLHIGGGFVASGGVLLNRVARWDTTAPGSWAPLGSGINGVGPFVAALLSFDEDDAGPAPEELYAGGRFTSAGSVAANSVARWDGTTWTPLGTGLNNDVFALASFDVDGGGPEPAAVFAGGAFTAAGSGSANRVARWIPSTGLWSPLGAGMNDTVLAFGSFDDDGDGLPTLYAGGRFTMAGGLPANRVAHWNGSEWSAIGTGLNGQVNALLTFDDDGIGPNVAVMYVGGAFTSAGGADAHGIARWDGAVWSGLGSGFGGLPALASSPLVSGFAIVPGANGAAPPFLYATGDFTTAGDVSSGRIARRSCTNPVAGDLDADGDIDLSDYALFAACLSGPVEPAEGGCAAADVTSDAHVDLGDFAIVSAAFTD